MLARIKSTFLSVFFFLFLGYPVWGVQFDIPSVQGIAINGTTYSRWMITGDAPGYSPYHSVFVADIRPIVRANPYLDIRYLFRIENPSVSDGYDAKQKVIGRYSVDFHTNIGQLGLKKASFIFGDLGKTTLGKGLL